MRRNVKDCTLLLNQNNILGFTQFQESDDATMESVLSHLSWNGEKINSFEEFKELISNNKNNFVCQYNLESRQDIIMLYMPTSVKISDKGINIIAGYWITDLFGESVIISINKNPAISEIQFYEF